VRHATLTASSNSKREDTPLLGQRWKPYQAYWQTERDKMVKTCNQCHSVNFAKEQLQHGDEMMPAAG